MEILNTIPTAEEFLNNSDFPVNKTEVWDLDVHNVMIAFAKLHREAILKSVIENVDFTDYTYQSMQQGSTVEVDKDSILNAYPVTLIK